MNTGIEFIGKCLFIKTEGKNILCVGDLHLGYEEVLNKAGVFVMRGMFDELIEDFGGVFDRLNELGERIDEIVLLGDVKHDFSSIGKQEWGDFGRLIGYLREKIGDGKIMITRGNHDNILEPIVRRFDVELVDFYKLGDVGFLHGNKIFDGVVGGDVKTVVIGHWHTAVKITDGTKVENYKCFLEGKWKGKKLILVPSFAEYSVGSDISGTNFEELWGVNPEKFDTFVVNGLDVLDFGKLERLR